MTEQDKKTIQLLAGTNSILEDRNKLLKKENKKLREQLALCSVVGQSEQLFCYHEGSYTLNEDGACCKCHRLPKLN